MQIAIGNEFLFLVSTVELLISMINQIPTSILTLSKKGLWSIKDLCILWGGDPTSGHPTLGRNSAESLGNTTLDVIY